MNIYFAPLEGITGFVFRNVYEKYYGGIDRYFTPFIATTQKTKLRNKEMRDILPEHNENICVIPQIMSNNASDFLYTAQFIGNLGYDTVNLNLGCPARTVVSKGKGSGFLAKPLALNRFLEEVYDKCSVKVSIKTRLGKDDPEEFYQLVKIFNQYPVEELIIHPRVQQDYYKNTPNWDMFAWAMGECRMPVCYNGNIFSMEDYERFHERFSDVDRIMLGRGPLSHLELSGWIRNGEVTPTDYEKLHRFILELCQRYEETMSGEQPVLFKMKEIWCYLIDSFPDSGKYRKKIHKTQKLSVYKDIVEELFAQY